MSTIESVAIHEFRDHLDNYTRENQEPIALTEGGERCFFVLHKLFKG